MAIKDAKEAPGVLGVDDVSILHARAPSVHLCKTNAKGGATNSPNHQGAWLTGQFDRQKITCQCQDTSEVNIGEVTRSRIYTLILALIKSNKLVSKWPLWRMLRPSDLTATDVTAFGKPCPMVASASRVALLARIRGFWHRRKKPNPKQNYTQFRKFNQIMECLECFSWNRNEWQNRTTNGQSFRFLDVGPAFEAKRSNG